MQSVSAFAPANISLFFSVYDHKNPRWKGSFGCGFTLSEGVTVTLEKSQKSEVFFNGKKIELPTVFSVIKKLINEKVNVWIASSLPLGAGFGISGASALATSYALNYLLNLGKTKKSLAIIAHTAEVENGTGLGDVVNQYFGGCLLKTKPSSAFSVKRLPVKKQTIYYKTFGKKSTKAFLETHSASFFKKCHEAYLGASDEVLHELSLQKKTALPIEFILRVGKKFCKETKFLKNKNIEKTIAGIEKRGGSASMVLLGNTVISTIPFEHSLPLHISETPACVKKDIDIR